MAYSKRFVLLMLLPAAALAAEPKLPAPAPVRGGLLERQEMAAAEGGGRFDFRLQDLGSVPGPVPGSRIHKLRDFENRSTCYLLVGEGGKAGGGSISCLKE